MIWNGGFKTLEDVHYQKKFFLLHLVVFPELGWALYLSGWETAKQNFQSSTPCMSHAVMHACMHACFHELKEPTFASFWTFCLALELHKAYCFAFHSRTAYHSSTVGSYFTYLKLISHVISSYLTADKYWPNSVNIVDSLLKGFPICHHSLICLAMIFKGSFDLSGWAFAVSLP